MRFYVMFGALALAVSVAGCNSMLIQNVDQQNLTRGINAQLSLS